jgi:N-acetylglutamate synthase-like GNAT family acetyltransferase
VPHVRRACTSDVGPITLLCGQLGYPADESSVADRFRAIEEDPRHAVFVAESDEGAVIGWIHVMPKVMLLSSEVGEIGGLIVDERERRKGVATTLLKHAEEWARENGYRELVVRSNTRRHESHELYPALGFESSKEQRVYRKPLE